MLYLKVRNITILIFVFLVASGNGRSEADLLMSDLSLAAEAGVGSNLRGLSGAAEMFANANQGRYPASISDLVSANPPYLFEDCCGKTIEGFQYSCNFSPKGYEFTATAVDSQKFGPRIFKAATGQQMTGPEMKMVNDPKYGSKPAYQYLFVSDNKSFTKKAMANGVAIVYFGFDENTPFEETQKYLKSGTIQDIYDMDNMIREYANKNGYAFIYEAIQCQCNEEDITHDLREYLYKAKYKKDRPIQVDGVQVRNDAQGQRVETSFMNNKKNGPEKTYYDTGELYEEKNYKDGNYDGIFKQYYKDGTLMAEYHFKNGESAGETRTYYEDGKLRSVTGSRPDGGTVIYDREGNVRQ
ncbi:MAG: hypothetical protein A2787_03235 [Omnitrophica WOR_2 bacterium RIFCSPHIGHO2_01_FULL_48_9]|nr:MAG: hypothetical protein A3D10_01105 [Omnitrophica WOR_2 bacterium RIFCSPHIGHO2_02_FULL_48_11]OGX32030.1 MAG: hypothetical protein A2787_03235 [Omnitrophica WOR_2 bacterium RIFCSPHIGHO2_01_FULL_48_9]